MKNIHVFKKDGLVCLYDVFSLKKRYLSVSRYAGMKLDVTDQDPTALKPPRPEFKAYQAVITTECNLACKYCSLFKNRGSGEKIAKMSMDSARELVKRYNKLVGKGLFIITGGEPLSNREVLQFLISEINGTKVLFTNGTLFNKADLDILVKNQVNIIFSMDGPAPVHDSMRILKNGEGSHERVRRAADLARENGVPYGISLVVREHNIADLEKIIEYLIVNFQPASIGINVPHFTEFSSFSIDPRMHAEKMIRIFQLSKKYKLYIDQLNRRIQPLIEEKFRFRDCSAMGEKIVEFPEGSFSHCVNVPPIGSLPEPDIWQNRMPVFLDECRDCWAIGVCGGGCSFDGINLYGEGKVDQRNCIITKALLEHFVWDIYAELKSETPSVADMSEKYLHLLRRGGALQISVGHDID